MLVSLTGPLEAILFACGSNGLTTSEIAHILQLSIDETKTLCNVLKQALVDRGAGVELTELAGTWQLSTRAEYVEYLRRMTSTPTSGNLSAAALEALAIVAYNQPITRVEIEAIRGVQSDRAIQTLVHRQLITEVGRQEGPGRPILYGTTDYFLQTFGLRDIDDLPPLPDTSDLLSQELSLFQIAPTLPRE